MVITKITGRPPKAQLRTFAEYGIFQKAMRRTFMFAIDQTRIGRPFGWRLALWIFLSGLLVIPLIAMQFTGEVVWDWFDFLVAAALLAGVGFSIELAIRFTSTSFARRIAIVIVVVGGILAWLQGAIGLV